MLLCAQHGGALFGDQGLDLRQRGARTQDGDRQRLAVLSDALLVGDLRRWPAFLTTRRPKRAIRLLQHSGPARVQAFLKRQPYIIRP